MKHYLTSKTVWLGLVVALIGGLQALQALPLSPTALGVITLSLGFLGIINRFLTTMPIGDTKAVVPAMTVYNDGIVTA